MGGRMTDDEPVFTPPSCDWPVCIGGECEYECEREDRSRAYFEEETEATRRALAKESHDD